MCATVLIVGRVAAFAGCPAVTVVAMGTYARPARVIADGVPHEVSAPLVSFAESRVLVGDPFGGPEHLYSTEPRWMGAIRARTASDAWAIGQADELVIKTEEGREGRFIVKHGGDLYSSGLQIAGSGSAPLDDEAGGGPV